MEEFIRPREIRRGCSCHRLPPGIKRLRVVGVGAAYLVGEGLAILLLVIDRKKKTYYGGKEREGPDPLRGPVTEFALTAPG